MKDAYAWNRAINMMNEIHQRMGLTWVYQMRLERLAVDNIAQKHIEEAIEFGKSLAAQPAPQQKPAMTYEQWVKENGKYIDPMDMDAWLNAAFDAGKKAQPVAQDMIKNPQKLDTSQERVHKLEKSNQMLLEALKELYNNSLGQNSKENYDMVMAREAIAAAQGGE